jgi:hypothetical protein
MACRWCSAVLQLARHQEDEVTRDTDAVRDGVPGRADAEAATRVLPLGLDTVESSADWASYAANVASKFCDRTALSVSVPDWE